MAAEARGGKAPRYGRAPGFALPVAIVVALVLGGIFFAVDRVVSGYRAHSTLFRDGELAWHAAQGALAVGEAALENLFGAPPPATGPARDLFDLVVRTPATALSGEDSLTLPILGSLLPPDVAGTVELVVRFVEVRPLALPLEPGFPADPLEKQGKLELEARARVGAATRTLVVRRPFRAFYRLPPVLGRFSLLFGELAGIPESPNALTYVPKLGTFHRSGSGALGWPLQVYPLPPTGDGRTPAERWGSDPTAPLRMGGWVGLLGETPWILNVCFGPGDGSPLEEGHLVRNFEAVFPSTAAPGSHEKARRLGFARNILELPAFADFEGESIPDASSLLHLYGDAREPIPAVVLGRAFRRFLTWSKLGSGAAGPFTSLGGAAPADFDPADPRVAAVLPGGSYDAYRAAMARSVVEPANRSYDFVVTQAETRGPTGTVEAGATPWSPERTLLAARTGPYLAPAGAGAEAFLYPDPATASTERGWGNVALKADDDAPLFTGSPDLILPGLARMLEARAAWRIEAPAGGGTDAASIFEGRFMPDRRTLRLGTAVHLAADPVRLGPLHVAYGGTLTVPGQLELVGPITCAPGETLALVSLGGNVRIANEEPIAALVAALAGEVQPSSRGLDLRGALVAARFDPLTWMAARGAQRIVYDPRLNPGLTATRLAQMRVHLASSRELVVDRR